MTPSARMVRAVIVSGMVCAALSGAASAQGRPGPFAGRLDSATARAVERLIDSVSVLGVPAEPLVAKALEGATKRAPSALIVDTVRRLAVSLAEARGALGSAARPDELVAGANAIRAGISPGGLRRLRQVRPQGALTVPLVVLGDLLARGVPADKGLTLIAAACQRGVADRDLLLVRDRVRADIQAGAGPTAAAELRIQGVLGGPAPYVSPLVLHPSAAITAAPGAGTQMRGALLAERGPARLLVEGFGAAGESAIRYAGFQASAGARVAMPGGLAGDVEGQASHGAPAAGPSELRLDGAARLYAGRNSGGGWIGVGARRYAGGGRVAGGPYATGGAWRRLGTIQLRLEVEHGALPLVRQSGAREVIIDDSVAIVQPGAERGVSIAATTTRLSVVLAEGRGAVDLSGGVIGGAGALARRWGQVNATVPITPRVALLAGAGTRGPGDFREGGVGGRFVRLGLRLAPWAAAPARAAPRAAPGAAGVHIELQPRGGERHALRVWAPVARTVELAGDMTGWTPAALARDPSGWWTLEVALAPGLYHLDLRIDGGDWMPPPGLATTGDGYGGLVGVVVVD